MNPKVTWFFEKETQWKDAYAKLRSIILECGLIEELKWGVPCYTFENKNIVLIHGFKNYCALLFHKGVLLSDPENILIQQTIHVQAARQIRFISEDEIEELKLVVKNYIYEALEIEKSGISIPLKNTSEIEIVNEFKDALGNNKHLKKAFAALTPGRQRAYLIHFLQAKQSQTRQSRIEKNIPNILIGKGLNE